MIRRPPRSTLLPCPTLFRSQGVRAHDAHPAGLEGRAGDGEREDGEEQPDPAVGQRHPSAPGGRRRRGGGRSEAPTSELQSPHYLVCRHLLAKKKKAHI